MERNSFDALLAGSKGWEISVCATPISWLTERKSFCFCPLGWKRAQARWWGDKSHFSLSMHTFHCQKQLSSPPEPKNAEYISACASNRGAGEKGRKNTFKISQRTCYWCSSSKWSARKIKYSRPPNFGALLRQLKGSSGNSPSAHVQLCGPH